MKRLFTLFAGGTAAIFVMVGCGTEVKVVSVTKTVERTVTADPTEYDSYKSGDDLAPEVKAAWNEDFPDNRISDVVCTDTPAFQNDTTRWECSADSALRGSISIDVKVDQETGDFTYEEQ